MKRLCFSILILILFDLKLWAQPHLPDGLILYDKPGATALIVDKTQCSVSVFQKQLSWEKVRQYQCTTGKSMGDKQYEGDFKTPTGLYFFTDAWTGQELIRNYGSLAKIYGAGAIELNYPNHLDTVFYKKNGSGIWLHGTDKGYPSATRGCISTTNADFLEVAQHVALHETPIIIEETITYASQEDIKKIRWELLNFIEQWKTTWESDQTEKYFTFYSGEFKTKKFNFRQWKKFKKLINRQNKNRQIEIRDISILKAKGIYNIQFIQRYSSSGTNDFGKKHLYIAKEQGEFHIISETWEALETSSSLSPQYVKINKIVMEKFKKQML